MYFKSENHEICIKVLVRKKLGQFYNVLFKFVMSHFI